MSGEELIWVVTLWCPRISVLSILIYLQGWHLAGRNYSEFYYTTTCLLNVYTSTRSFSSSVFIIQNSRIVDFITIWSSFPTCLLILANSRNTLLNKKHFSLCFILIDLIHSLLFLKVFRNFIKPWISQKLDLYVSYIVLYKLSISNFLSHCDRKKVWV